MKTSMRQLSNAQSVFSRHTSCPVEAEIIPVGISEVIDKSHNFVDVQIFIAEYFKDLEVRS